MAVAVVVTYILIAYACRYSLGMHEQQSIETIDLSFLAFFYLHILCMQEAKALDRLRGCAGLSEPSLLADMINTKNSCTGPIDYLTNAPRKNRC